MIENFSSEFLAFCRNKPAGEAYNSGSGSKCALGQFVASKGFHGWFIGGYSSDDTYGPEAIYPDECWNAALTYPVTFGALVQRLEAAGIR